MACMWLSPLVWNFVEMVANRAQMSLASRLLPPCPKQNTCRARCSNVAAWSMASGSSALRVPFSASMAVL